MSDQSSKTLESMSQAIWYNRWTLEKFAGLITGDILEVGCGIGNFTKSLTKYGKVTAIDINNDYLEQAKKKVAGKARIGFGDVEKGKYFFKGRVFDTIVCINVLEHIKDDVMALKNIYKLLKLNGTLILHVPAHPFLYVPIDGSIGHFRRYEKEKLVDSILRSGFEIDKIKRLNLIGAVGWFIVNKLFRDKEVKETKIAIFNLVAPIFLSLENIFEPSFGTSILIIASKKET